MPVKTFTVPVHFAEAAEQEFNQFLASHTVLGVERRFVDHGMNSFWTFCVDYAVLTKTASKPRTGKERVDYREVLSPEDFDVYARLRDVRKQLAEAEGIAVYLVFTNEQLAEIVKQKVTTKSALEKIAGIGQARVKKYGDPILEALTKDGNGKTSGAAV